ncbi:hypothetical protein Y1Q_0022053 [Alligator mississippiensis]|uniref:Reverse transcriptase domain-containing protein n=1 Tax=Alligator mississippiensis TaxID=8496 RepID=A0A151NLV4_ALLMI|nr:hypothetical protein Y1Q_0022053 [Alligator mississippiensis]
MEKQQDLMIYQWNFGTSCGEEGINILWEMFKAIFATEKMPNLRRGSVLVAIFKQKDDVQNCGNDWRVTLKVWKGVVKNWLRTEVVIGEGQYGFMLGKSTMDPVFAIRQMMKKYREDCKDIRFIFIDLEKAYDHVPREDICECLRIKVVLETYVRIIKDTYWKCEEQFKRDKEF